MENKAIHDPGKFSVSKESLPAEMRYLQEGLELFSETLYKALIKEKIIEIIEILNDRINVVGRGP